MNRQETMRASRFLKTKFGPDRLNGRGLSRLLAEYKEWTEPSDCDIPAIRLYIEEKGLNRRTRHRDFSYRRFYMYAYLRDIHKVTYSDIGRMFGKDHSSVLYGISKHRYWMKHRDKVYMDIVSDLIKRFVL